MEIVWYMAILVLVLLSVLNKVKGIMKAFSLVLCVILLALLVFYSVDNGLNTVSERLPYEGRHMLSKSPEEVQSFVGWVKRKFKDVKYTLDIM